jgi:hypothetical protein
MAKHMRMFPKRILALKPTILFWLAGASSSYPGDADWPTVRQCGIGFHGSDSDVVTFNPSILANFLNRCMVLSGRDGRQISEGLVKWLFADITDPSDTLNLLTIPRDTLAPVMAELQLGLMLDVNRKTTDRTRAQQWRVRKMINVPLLSAVGSFPVQAAIPIAAMPIATVGVDEAVDDAQESVLGLNHFDGDCGNHEEPACPADVLLTRNGYAGLWSAANPAQRRELLSLLEDPDAFMGALSTREIYKGEDLLNGPLGDSERAVVVELTWLLRQSGLNPMEHLSIFRALLRGRWSDDRHCLDRGRGAESARGRRVERHRADTREHRRLRD